MSRPQGPYPGLFQFENALRMMLPKPKGSYMSPHLLAILDSFEEKLECSLQKLIARAKDNVLSLSWMKQAMESLCETHNDIKTLIVDLELPVANWDEEWADVYLNSSMKLLDLCNAFSSEISRLSQGHLILQLALQEVDSSTAKFASAHRDLSRWKHHTNTKNPRLEKCTSILESIIATLNLPKVKNSTKGKVLMRAMYGMKVKTLLIGGILTAAFSRSPKKLVELHVPEAFPWADAFTRLQALVKAEIRIQFSDNGATTVLKEVRAVYEGIRRLLQISQPDDESTPVHPEGLKSTISELRNAAEKYSHAMDLLSTEVDCFFQILLEGRDTLLCSLRSSITIPNLSKKKMATQSLK